LKRDFSDTDLYRTQNTEVCYTVDTIGDTEVYCEGLGMGLTLVSAECKFDWYHWGC